MKRRVSILLIGGLLGCATAVWGQNGAGQSGTAQSGTAQSGTDATGPNKLDGEIPRERPLTPEEQRARQIEKYDPKSNQDPRTMGQGDDPRNGTGGQGDTAAQSQTQGPRVTEPAPLPGSVAAGQAQAKRPGPRVIGDDQDSDTTDAYTGPAVLSRSYTISRPMTSQAIRWSPGVGFTASRDTGLTTGVVGPNGEIGSVASYGYGFNWSLNGRHLWRRDQLGVNYIGAFNRYAGGRYGGTNQNFSADFGHIFNRRLSFNAVATASTYSQSYALENPLAQPGVSVANMNIAASPNVQILDQGTKQLSIQAGFTYQFSGRLSANGSLGTFFVQRATAGFVGMTGEQAQGDINYRLTRRMTVGAYYSFSSYVYSHCVNTAAFNTLGLIFSYAFSRTFQFRSRIGGTMLESAGLEAVPLDPVIAAILGQAAALVEGYRLTRTSDLSGQLVKDFGRNRTASLSYARGVAPGNGAILTSVQETIAASFGLRLFRQYALNMSVGTSDLVSAAQTAGRYRSQYGALGIYRTFRRGLSGGVAVDYRQFNITHGSPVTSQLRISTTVNWSPPENWLRGF
jgi:hypothetical protein